MGSNRMRKIIDPVGVILPQVPQVTPTPAPEIPPEETMPTAPNVDAEAAAKARRRTIIDAQRRRGRASTILTDQSSEPLGG